MMAAAIRNAFDEDAVTVAERQAEVAETPSRADWLTIVERLRRP